MTFSEILNILLGGGFLALMVGVITLRATVRKANAEAAQAQAEAKKAEAEAERARAEAESVRITNTENATRILVENIVKPLQEELYATRRDLLETKREMVRLRRSVESASGCPHAANCPVMHRLRYGQKGQDGGDSDGGGHDGHRHGIIRNKSDPAGDSAQEPG